MREPPSGPGISGRKSNSAYALPLDTVSVDGMLKIVDCAIRVCAATENIKATNNTEKSLFMALPASLSAKKNAQNASTRCRTGRRRLQKLFAAQLRAAKTIL